MNEIYAHSLEGQNPEHWQPLSEHLGGVADRASGFAKIFKSEAWAQIAGWFHDLGKARQSFQNYLRVSNGLTDSEYDASEHSHSGAGAVWAVQTFPKAQLGRIFAYCVAGHHAGLPDWVGGVAPSGSLSYRLDQEKDVLQEPTVAEMIHSLPSFAPPPGPWRFAESDVSFWIRMLYSCLVDADFLDTEEFMNRQVAQTRCQYPDLTDLATRFFTALDAKEQAAPDTEVNRIRAEIRQACEKASVAPKGLFSLTVPTGGGKTLSGTAFALRHALKHGFKRVIYVIPYTSIIEQTADTLRAFLGKDNVVEHHSNFDPDKETQQSRLASENWDAPVIVTTNVQFFESLYACKSSRCRKLHNIADSVVILDEAQLLPPRLLLPCVKAITQLVKNYGVSLVLSTATQPALPGLTPPCEIIPPELRLYDRLKRTKIVLPEDMKKRRTWEEMAGELKQHNQVLCIVNTRRDCRELHALMPEGTIHLSATMCGEHRSCVIATIKERLQTGQPVRVISTQLVEAGVDFDFPVVYRAFTGLPSIAQAAGRCNREGRSPALGKVVVFMPPKQAPHGELRKAEDTLLGLLALAVDPESPDSYPRFFENFYKAQNELGEEFSTWLEKDARYIQFQFREASNAFKMIDDQASVSIVVRYGGNEKLVDTLRLVGPKRDIMRRLQRYAVNVPRSMLPALFQKGFVEEVHPGVYVQTLPSLYDKVFGFDLYRDGLTPEDLIMG